MTTGGGRPPPGPTPREDRGIHGKPKTTSWRFPEWLRRFMERPAVVLSSLRGGARAAGGPEGPPWSVPPLRVFSHPSADVYGSRGRFTGAGDGRGLAPSRSYSREDIRSRNFTQERVSFSFRERTPRMRVVGEDSPFASFSCRCPSRRFPITSRIRSSATAQ